MSSPVPCRQCGTVLPRRALGGLCPRCIGRRVLADHSDARPEAGAAEPWLDEWVGRKIGRYELVRKLGEGGCGVVYAADQDEPVRRRVALKVIKLGMDTKAVVARFHGERQAMAMMDHPGIARVFDAGAAADGRPYFVMELVEGSRITEFCDAHRLPLRNRLELFVEVCQAVQHAHQKGIIHRDLKPSNVLVSRSERTAVPKVIDFGIAKALWEPLTDATLATKVDQVLGTPDYMSPEQAESGGRDVDTRSDIYSLGVLLYELLVGSTPHAPAAGRGDPRSPAARDREFLPPSTRCGTFSLVHLETVAALRGTDPKSLGSLLRGDLDWIVMKCLERDRSLRYRSASDLAEDLRRHLDDQPVSAAAPRMGYKVRKFVRRHTLALASATLVILLLLATAGISLVLATRATRAERLAGERLAEFQTAQRESDAVAELLVEIFQGPNPGHNRRSITVAEVLGGAAQRLEHQMRDHPERQARLEMVLGDTYRSLGLIPEAMVMREKVYEYRRKTLGPDHTNTLAALDALAQAYLATKRRDTQAIELFQRVLIGYRKIYGYKHPVSLGVASRLAWAIHGTDNQKGLAMEEEVLTLSREVNGDEHPNTLDAMKRLGYHSLLALRYARARELLDEAARKLERQLGASHPNTISARIMQAACLGATGQPEDAVIRLQELVSLSQKVNGPFHPDNLFAMSSLADAQAKAGRPDEATRIHKRALAISRQINPPGHSRTQATLRSLVKLSTDSGRTEEAEQLRQELALEREAAAADESQTTPNFEARLVSAGTSP